MAEEGLDAGGGARLRAGHKSADFMMGFRTIPGFVRRHSWQFLLGIGLVVLSGLLYFLHYLVFRDPHHIFIYLLGDIAFVPVDVLLVTLIIHRLLTFKDKRNRLAKLNMVIGAFFSEAGTALLTLFSDFDPRLEEIHKELVFTDRWTDREFRELDRRLRRHVFSVDIARMDLVELRDFLVAKRDFLLRLLENQNLIEHESFTDLLWAITHLTEELVSRKDLMHLPASDERHLGVDIQRAYTALVHHWLAYMGHLKRGYPYLFSLAMRTNPFDETASPVVK